MSFHRWGFNLGRLYICWWDEWERRPLLEISWQPSGAQPIVFVEWGVRR